MGTPIVPTSVLIDQGSIGDIYADIDEDDLFTVYNTGKAGATVQCFIFNDVEYANAYYEMYKEDSEQKVSIDGKNVIFEKEENIDSKDDIYSYKKYRDSLIGQGYSCEK